MAARWSAKDYELVAGLLRRYRPDPHDCDRGESCPMAGDLEDAYDVGASAVLCGLTVAFGKVFQADSARFDLKRFELAAGQ